MESVEIKRLLREKKYSLLKDELLNEQVVDIAEFIDKLNIKADVILVFRLLPKEIAAEVFPYLSSESQSEISMLVDEKELAEILDDLYFDDKIDFLEEMPASVVNRILQNASESERKLINQFLNYPDDSAGSIMTIEFVHFKKEMTVQEALDKIRSIAPGKETIYTCYVSDAYRRLEGIVSLRDLVLYPPTDTIADIMRTDIISIDTLDDKEYTADLIKKYNLLAIPVTDHEKRLVGIITVDDIIDVMEDETTEDFHKMATVGEINTSLLDASPWLLLRRRIPWLLILVFVNIFSGAGIAHFQETIESVIALVFFLPLLIDSAGNAGSQSATLMIRALAVGDVRIEDWFQLIKKEFLVAIPLGLFMALAVSLVGFFRAGIDVAVVVALSMVVIVVVGSTVGMSLPFVLNRFNKDPATASGPLVTSIADIAGVLIYFSIARWYLGI